MRKARLRPEGIQDCGEAMEVRAMKKMVVGMLVIGLVAAMSSGCAVKRYKAQNTALKKENLELQMQVAQLETDCANLYNRNEILLKEMKKSRGEPVEYAEPRTTGDSGVTKLLKSKGLEVVERDGNPSVIVTDLFNPGSASLSSDDKSRLKKVADAIKSVAGTTPMRIDGYTDNQPTKVSKYETNKELSLARAEAVERG
ncbi:MAG: OmpA family protein, partial [Planctomycetes bacterium]|nr:OmpA family protein [Planctomycetota bacterium]